MNMDSVASPAFHLRCFVMISKVIFIYSGILGYLIVSDLQTKHSF